MYGTIALDIDGTLTTGSMGHNTLPPRVVSFLANLAITGWQMMFITGRTFETGHRVLKDLPFPYYLAVQNGAIIFEMPSRYVIAKKYVQRSVFETMEAICHGQPTDFVLYSGYEYDDKCFYRPKRFSTKLLTYLKERMKGFKESWHEVDSYDEVPVEAFPSIKCFGDYDSAIHLSSQIETRIGLHVPIIRDPYDERYYVIQATHPQTSKGQALLDLLAVIGRKGKVIAAGDDLNDCPMLAVADIKIAMATAPQELLQMADIIAPPVTEEGIITALQDAIKRK